MCRKSNATLAAQTYWKCIPESTFLQNIKCIAPAVFSCTFQITNPLEGAVYNCCQFEISQFGYDLLHVSDACSSCTHALEGATCRTKETLT